MTSIASLMMLVQLTATMAMVGLIWFVQIVHYPLYRQVGPERFVEYERSHNRLTTYVVAPLMVAELASAVFLVARRPPVVSSWLPVASLALLASIWLVTYAVQVPQHSRLCLMYDAKMIERLVTGNWIRTIAWTTRGVLLLVMLSQVFQNVENTTVR